MICAIVAVDRQAVDARPLVCSGFLKASSFRRGSGENQALTDNLFAQLSVDERYATLMWRLIAAIDEAAQATANDLSCDVGSIRGGYTTTLGRWQVALWRLEESVCRFVLTEPAGVVVCPSVTS